MIDVHSDETLRKAREMLCDMAKLADENVYIDKYGKLMSQSKFVATMWEAFNKGRKYGEFIKDSEKPEPGKTLYISINGTLSANVLKHFADKGGG